MKIAVLKESKANEKRVSLTPKIVDQLTKKGFECLIEKNAGILSSFDDESYQLSGGIIYSDLGEICNQADVILKVNPPTPDEINHFKAGTVLISLIYHTINNEIILKLAEKQVSVFSIDAMPRISRAQSMDVLSSQNNLAGYKSVLMGANAMTKIFPMMMTAAGTIVPAKVLIFGVGVAGLQAIATAKRLGAVVEATDVRPETKEQVESLGGKFIEVKSEGQIQTEGGYAKNVSEEFLRKQKETLLKHLSQADLVITTALVMGRKAPVLITEEMVKSMKRGAVIVDMAVEQGGNCEISVMDKTVEKHGVTIIGQSNIPSMLATTASELFAKNISTFLLHLTENDRFKWEMEEEITKGTLITHKGQIVR